MAQPLVSVIIPAFNASVTLDATLWSARAQTHRELEILVVDDGSTDDTAECVERHVADDSRVRLLRQANGGVARARNAGLAVASGVFIAPLDSDDLWHPTKIARQVAALDAAGEDFALAYNWFRRIDTQDRVAGVSASPRIDGRVLHRHIDWNFISNGSTPLVRTAVARAIGYEPALRDAGVQGTEDYLFQMRVARAWRFACVPAFLTGYRAVPGAMSTDTARMIRSHIMAYSLLRTELDEAAAWALVDRRIATLRIELGRNLLRRGALPAALGQGFRSLLLDRAGAWQGISAEIRALRRRRAPRSLPGESFDTVDPDGADAAWVTRRSAKWLRHLAVLDGE